MEQKDAKSEISKDVDAGDYNVTFYTMPKQGFRVKISGGFMSSIILTRKEVRLLQPALAKASQLVDYVDSQIKF